MYKNVELMFGDKLLRGVVRTPEGDGPFPCVCFYHGFTVDKVGMMRLHELWARRCVAEGFACVRFDFYGCGESDGDFVEMRFFDELEEAKAIYHWAEKQPWADPQNLFITGHSLGGAICSVIAPVLQPRGVALWAPGNTGYYDISKRANSVPGHYEEKYDIGGMYIAKEFLEQMQDFDIVAASRGYKGKVLLVQGELDERIPVASIGPYLHMYGDQVESVIIWGANHQFSSVAWKTQVYDVTIDYLKKQMVR